MISNPKIFRWKLVGILLSLVGALISWKLLLDHRAVALGKGISLAFCDSKAESGCRIAALSPFSAIAGVPVALLALVYFSVNALTPGARFQRTWLCLQTVAILVSFFYLAIMLGFMEQPCRGCLWIHGLNIALGVTRFKIWRSTTDRRTPETFPIRNFLTISVLLGSLTALSFLIYTVNLEQPGRQFRVIREEVKFALDSKYSLELGRSGKEISLTMALDPACPYCKENLLNLSEALVATRMRAKVQIILFPMDPKCNPGWETASHGSCSAAKIAICLADKGHFSEFIRRSMQDQGMLVEDLKTAVNLAESNPVEQRRLYECTQSSATQTTLDQHLKNASGDQNRHPVNSVPTTWFQGYRIEGRMHSHEWVKLLNGKLE